MKNRTDVRKFAYSHVSPSVKTLMITGFAAILALGILSAAFYTRTVATQELEKDMPTLRGEAAVLTEGAIFESLVGTIGDEHPPDSPAAQIKLVAPDGGPSSNFGRAVAISGDTAVVGANRQDAQPNDDRGAAYVYVRDGENWTFQQKLTASDASPGAQFGWAVTISGNTIIVGAPEHIVGLIRPGAAYVFVRNGTVWSEQQKLLASDGLAGDAFGTAVDLNGETAVIGAHTRDIPGDAADRGAAYVFDRNGTTWSQSQLLTASGTSRFGQDISVSSDTLVIGAPLTTVSGNATRGSAYVFIRSGSTWDPQATLISDDGVAGDNFGTSVILIGDQIIVGSPRNRIGINNLQGAAYVFARNGTTWSQQQKLSIADGVAFAQFGLAMASDGTSAIIGSTGVNGFRGAAYVFAQNGATWTQQALMTADDGAASDNLGASVGMTGEWVIAGAYVDDIGSNVDQGSAYMSRLCELLPAGCDPELEVNVTNDLADVDLEDDICDVDSSQSGQQCSLRAAIETANANSGPDTIKFNIPGTGTHTITTLTQLPSLNETATIDATTQPGYSGTPLIELSGNSALGGIGFVSGSTNSILRGMAINRFAVGVGLQVSGVTIERCYFNLSPDGSAAGTASDHVLAIDIRGAAATNNTIGGTGNLGNIISNSNVGVGISEGATGNKIFGNRIGTNVSGTGSIPNVVGAFISASSGNKIGDAAAGTGNLISGNSGSGVVVNLGSSNNIVTGNLIGTNATGIEAIANGNGVIVDASNNNRVGSDTGLNGNVISGSTFTAVTLKTGATNNVVAGNKIGTNLDGTAAIPNQFGIGIDAANDNTIGDLLTSAKGNLISGNTNTGVVVQGGSENNRVSFNSIGTKENGTELLQSGEVGILLTGGATNNILEANVIGGHTLQDSGSGIGIAASAGPANQVMDNFIGVARDGATALPNYFGIGIAGDGQTVGSISRKNLIGKNIKAGIVLSPATGNPQVENNTIEGNLVGTNGTNNVGNDEFGIWLNGAVNDNTIKSNYVGGNVFVGIAITDGSTSNDILDNRIGVNVGSSAAIPNGIGIWVRQATNNTISQNLVCGNDLGMLIGTNIGFGSTAGAVASFHGNSPQSDQGGTFTTGNTVHTNIIGIGPAGPIPNKMGIAIGENARNNFIGTATGANLISGNTATIGYGMFLGTLAAAPTEDSLPQFNIIQRNYIGLSADLQSTVSNNIGFVLLQAKSNTIGGDSDATANIIVASTQEGVSIRDGTRENTFLKNYVGVLPPGFGSRTKARFGASPNGAYGNGSHGILVENGASGNILGGETSGSGMVIADNGGNGIRVASTAGSGNRMGANSITNNALPGIDLGGDGVTPNDPTDADVGPNNLQNYPTMTFFISGGNLIVNYQVDSALANSNYGTTGLTVQFFEADGSGAGVGLLGSDQYTASDYSNGTPGFRKKNLGNAAALGFVEGDTMTATATDADGNSSEFTPAVSSAPSAISGTITYGNAIGSPSPRFVSNVLLSGAGSTNVSTTTAAPGTIAGQYTLMGFGAGSYTVTPTKTGGINNITSFDAARISQHVAGPPNPQLTGNQLVVADVSGNTSVTSFDAAMIAKFVAGPPYAAPGIGSTATWRFTPLNRVYASVTNSVTGEDFSALLMGEVSGNWSNTGARPASRPNAECEMRNAGCKEIAVDLPNVVSAVEKEINVPITVEGIADKGVIAYEFDLRYDPSVMQPAGDGIDLKDTISSGLSVATNSHEPGLLRVVVYGAYPIDSDGVLLNLRFTAVGASGSASPLSIKKIMFNEGEPRVVVTDGKVELAGL